MTPPPATHHPTGPDIILPASFRAFCTLQHPAYRAYTAAHTHPAETENLMSRAFGDLAAHWSDILLRPDPTAYAWDLFAGNVRRHTKRLRISTASPLQYEIVVLHHIARCTIDRTSDTTGRTTEKIRYLLSTWNP
ncbi:hypothetical protein OG772_36070 [Streptomyces sp. NBC_01321]|uniref:hypothetical protein n=1 Tax=Streptomyces sp. NBC_01321 TaxID=2903825 RepID=UPI002E0DEB2F|nr:hypothetical protein OG772_36070 [Streptomyces sp. NBC_01321]